MATVKLPLNWPYKEHTILRMATVYWPSNWPHLEPTWLLMATVWIDLQTDLNKKTTLLRTATESWPLNSTNLEPTMSLMVTLIWALNWPNQEPTWWRITIVNCIYILLLLLYHIWSSVLIAQTILIGLKCELKRMIRYMYQRLKQCVQISDNYSDLFYL